MERGSEVCGDILLGNVVLLGAIVGDIEGEAVGVLLGSEVVENVGIAVGGTESVAVGDLLGVMWCSVVLFGVW